MRRIIVIAIFIACFVCSIAFSDTDMLIDFNQLKADVLPSADGVPQENSLSLVDYASEAGVNFTDEERARMKSSLALNNWRVTLASSSRTVERQSLCYTKEAKTTKNLKEFQGDPMEERTVLGVRVRFPESTFNSYAIVRPPFEIQAYQDKEVLNGDKLEPDPASKGKSDKFDNKGVIKNVGTIKEITVDVYGANYPHALEVVLMDQDYVEKSYHICYLDYEGWGRRTWQNPNYIIDVRNRDIKKYPLYPRSVPYIKFIGFVIYRDASALGGDFITYFKDVRVTYDKAIKNMDDNSIPINDEEIWGIIKDRNEKRKQAEYRRMGDRMVMESIEKGLMNKETNAKTDSTATTPKAK
jgi:hypothetical protein